MAPSLAFIYKEKKQRKIALKYLIELEMQIAT